MYFGINLTFLREEAGRNMMRMRILMILKRKLILTSKIQTQSRFLKLSQLPRRMWPLLRPVRDQMTILR